MSLSPSFSTTSKHGFLKLHSIAQNRFRFPYNPKSYHNPKPYISGLFSSLESTTNGRFPNSIDFSSKAVSDSDCRSGGDPEKNDETVESPSLIQLVKSVGAIGLATTTSKTLGLLREITLAAVFGVGPVATAFNHASIFPSFCASLLGGVNGPIHVIVTTSLSNHSKKRGRKIIQNAYAVVFLVGCVLGSLVYIFAKSIIYVSAPGLWVLEDGQITAEIAITQLKLMTPCVLFAGPVGLGFGCLSAAGDNIIPSLSPAISSIAIILLCIAYRLLSGSSAFYIDDALSGGVFISCGASIGAFFQWLIQVIMYWRTGYGLISISWKNSLKDKDVHKLFALMLSAILSAGLVQIASFTDLYFASFIPGAAAGLSYAHLLAMAPLGILSNTTVLPLLPNLSRLAKSSSWASLKDNLQEAILLCMVILLPIMSAVCALAQPVISFLFQRLAFDSSATALVSSLLLCYSVGSPFYIIREFLVVVFYALGDGQVPFLISAVAIFFNGFLDWLFISRFSFGAHGLVLSTSCVTALSAFLLHLLSEKLRGLVNFTALVGPLLLLPPCCIITGFTTFIVHRMFQHLLPSIAILRFRKLFELLYISLAGLLGMLAFFIPLVLFQFPGMKLVKNLFTALTTR